MWCSKQNACLCAGADVTRNCQGTKQLIAGAQTNALKRNIRHSYTFQQAPAAQVCLYTSNCRPDLLFPLHLNTAVPSLASAGTMSCVVEELPFDPTDLDKALGDLLIGHEGSTQQFLTSVFSFLKRKTNFFKEPEPKRRVLEAFRQVAGEAAAADGFRGGFFGAAPRAAARQVRYQEGVSCWCCLI